MYVEEELGPLGLVKAQLRVDGKPEGLGCVLERYHERVALGLHLVPARDKRAIVKRPSSPTFIWGRTLGGA